MSKKVEIEIKMCFECPKKKRIGMSGEWSCTHTGSEPMKGDDGFAVIDPRSIPFWCPLENA